MRKKLRSQRGMTLTELLCGILVMLLATALLTVGVRFAANTYRTSMEASEAQVLCSTLTTAISDKLRYCGRVTSNEDGTLVKIFIQNVGSVEGDAEGSGQAFGINSDGQVILGTDKLVGTAVYPAGLRVKELTLTYEDTSREFTVELQIVGSADTTLAETAFQVRRLTSDNA